MQSTTALSTFSLCAAGSALLSGASHSVCDRGQIRISEAARSEGSFLKWKIKMINTNTWFRFKAQISNSVEVGKKDELLLNLRLWLKSE